jgi:hypothetical protein
LAAELQRTTFRPTERTVFAVRTAEIRKALAQPLPAYPARASEVSQVINALARTLDAAVTPDANAEKIKTCCDHAERLRRLLIELIAK